MKELFREPIRYDAVLQLTCGEFPELKRATVVITDNGDDALIGVKALYRKTGTKDGYIFASMEQVGDYCKVSKSCTVDEFFCSLKNVLERVSNMVERAEKGEYSQNENEMELGAKA